MSLYPSLEDMKVDHLRSAQTNMMSQQQQPQIEQNLNYPPPSNNQPQLSVALYPSLIEYMGLEITAEQQKQLQPFTTETRASGNIVAPVSGNQNLSIARSEIKQGVRQTVMCKDASGKIGIRVRAVSKGIFVALVHRDSPASLAGLRFGDQILQINGENVAGWDTDKCMKVLQKCAPDRIEIAVRDRPFERIITMQKDSLGHVGFVFKDGKITAIVKDSSAARNGLLIDQQLIEVGGINVVGLKDSEISKIIDNSGLTITITIMPTFIYQHIMKCMGSSLKKLMDHSLPDL